MKIMIEKLKSEKKIKVEHELDGSIGSRFVLRKYYNYQKRLVEHTPEGLSSTISIL